MTCPSKPNTFASCTSQRNSQSFQKSMPSNRTVKATVDGQATTKKEGRTHTSCVQFLRTISANKVNPNIQSKC